MPTYDVVSLGGNNIQDATYVSVLQEGTGGRARSANLISLTPLDRYPRATRFDQQSAVFPLAIWAKTGALAAIDQLMRWFRPGTSASLVVSFDGTQRVRDCRVQAIDPHAIEPFCSIVTLRADDPRWRAASATTTQATLTASGQSIAPSNTGTAVEDKAVITLKPTTLKTQANSYRYFHEFVIANKSPEPLPDDYAIDVAVAVGDSGWNTQAEVSAGRMLSSGNDLRVLVDGVEVPRWLSGMNTTTTRIWFLCGMPAAVAVTLLTAMTAGSPANGGEVEIQSSDFASLPDSGAFIWDSEVITYTSKTIRNSNGRAALQGIARQARATSAASHTAGTVGYLITRRVQVVHGWSNAPAPDTRDEIKPLLDLATSDNDTHVWPDFIHVNAPRAMQWSRLLVARDSMTDKILAWGPDISTPAGTLVLEYQSNGAKADFPNYNAWARRFPTGLATTGTMLAMLRSVADSLGFVIFGRDADGNEIELSRESGPIASSTLSLAAQTIPIYGIELYGRQQVIWHPEHVGAESSLALPQASTQTVADFVFQKVTISEGGDFPLSISRVVAWLTDTGPLANAVRCYIWSDSSGAPGSPLVGVQVGLTPSSSGYVTFNFTGSNQLYVQPGQVVHVGFQNNTMGGAEPVTIRTWPIVLENDTIRSLDIKVISASINPSPQAVGTNGHQIAADTITATLYSGGIPYWALRGQEDAYWLNGRLQNTTTGQYVDLQILCRLTDEIEIDMAERTVRNITRGEDVMYGVRFSDPDDWISLMPGTNTLTWTETGVVGLLLKCVHHSRWE